MNNGNRCPQTVFLPKSDPKMSTVAQNIGGVGVQIGRVVEKTSEMGSLVALRAGEIESHPSVPPSVTDLAAKRPKILGFFAGFTEKRYNF